MIKGKRPAEPASLRDEATVREMTRARRYYAPNPARTPAFDFQAYRDDDVKEALWNMFNGKCAYCEAPFINQGVHVEHFRPKGGVQPQRGAAMQAGYWWLASHWENLLPTCIDCNSEVNHRLPDGTRKTIGKGNYFPLPEGQQHAKSLGYLHAETPLLINPAMVNPKLYFEFSLASSGRKTYSLIRPRTFDPAGENRAELSIDAYALNRHRLVLARTARLKELEADLQDWRKQLVRLERSPASVAKAEDLAEVQGRLESILKRYVASTSPFSAACYAFVSDWLQHHQLAKPPEQLQANAYS